MIIKPRTEKILPKEEIETGEGWMVQIEKANQVEYNPFNMEELSKAVSYLFKEKTKKLNNNKKKRGD